MCPSTCTKFYHTPKVLGASYQIGSEKLPQKLFDKPYMYIYIYNLCNVYYVIVLIGVSLGSFTYNWNINSLWCQITGFIRDFIGEQLSCELRHMISMNMEALSKLSANVKRKFILAAQVVLGQYYMPARRCTK